MKFLHRTFRGTITLTKQHRSVAINELILYALPVDGDTSADGCGKGVKSLRSLYFCPAYAGIVKSGTSPLNKLNKSNTSLRSFFLPSAIMPTLAV